MVEVTTAFRGVIEGVDGEWYNRMATRYGSWVSAAELDILTWGLFVFKKHVSVLRGATAFTRLLFV